MDTANDPREPEEMNFPNKTEKEEEPIPPDAIDQSAQDSSIDAMNKAQGTKLVLVHTALCLCTFLVGLVCPY